MKSKSSSISLLQEEKRSAVLFTWLFYIVFFAYDIFYYYSLPSIPWSVDGIQVDGIIVLKYTVFIGLLPLIVYLAKHRPQCIKYMLFATYLLFDIVEGIWTYWGSNVSYSSGNLVELLIILFSPIFINKRFFYLVSLGSMLKYVLIGLVIQDFVVAVPIFINLILSVIAFILLHRFMSYVATMKASYEIQLEGMVKGVITTLELKDPYTRGHSVRVAEYANRLAKATGQFRESELNHFYYACLLHDIGKVNIPDAILTKPGKLTDEEYAIVKTHPVVGAKAIQDVDGISENIGVIYHHHERWDGQGYPSGLKEEETPLLARVTAIADAFDAMTSSRSYRAALSVEEAYQRILAGKGTQFDPRLVDTFQEIYPSWATYHRDHHTQNHDRREVNIK